MAEAKRPFTLSDQLQLLVGATVLALVFCVAMLGSLGEDGCARTVYVRAVSDGLSARGEKIDCGKTSGSSRRVVVQSKWLPQAEWLACDALVLDGDWPVRLRWGRRGELAITSPAPDEAVSAMDYRCHGRAIRWRSTAPRERDPGETKP